ncbi:MAG TPA: hypothetical protein VIA09_00840 [Nitrososphaeraceae archaeon]
MTKRIQECVKIKPTDEVARFDFSRGSLLSTFVEKFIVEPGYE